MIVNQVHVGDSGSGLQAEEAGVGPQYEGIVDDSQGGTIFLQGERRAGGQYSMSVRCRMDCHRSIEEMGPTRGVTE